jgi:hypothetical protein
MSRLWRWILPCYLFTLPMTMAGWVISVLFYKASSWRWQDGILSCIGGTLPDGTTRIWGRPNAQTLGWIVIYDSEEHRQEVNLRVHEAVHVGQAFVGSLVGLAAVPWLFLVMGWSPVLGLVLGGFIGGLGFAGLYGILFLYLLLKYRTGWYNAYRANPFEVQAYDLQDKYLADVEAGRNPKPWGA